MIISPQLIERRIIISHVQDVHEHIRPPEPEPEPEPERLPSVFDSL